MKTVLVDDQSLFRDGVSSLLLAWGREVTGRPGGGDQAIELVEAASETASSRAAREGGLPPAEVAIVVLTVSAEEAKLFRAIKAGAQGHLPPDLEAPRLRSMLESVARGESGTSTRPRHSRVAGEFQAERVASGGDLRRLTERELEVLGLVTEGLRNRQIAAAMEISENTVKFHLKNIAEKLHASNRAELAARAVRSGLVPEAGHRR